MRPTTLACLLGLGLVACGNDREATGPDAQANVPRATWYQDVAPILSKHCMSCHQAGGIAPFALTDYDSARERGELMLVNVDKGVMPPFDAREEPDCTPRFGWKDDQRLSAVEKQTLHAWVEDGLAIGTVAAIATPASIDLPNVSTTLKPAAPFVSSGTRDQFICYVLDPKVTAPVGWMTGMQVRPGNDLVVHHAVLTEVTPGPAQDALVAQRGIGLPFDCDGTTPGAFVIGIWTPGNQPMQTPADLAVPILKDAKVVMQIHYHPAGTTNLPDATEVDLRFSPQWPKKMYFVAAIGNEVAAPQLQPDPDDRTSTPEFVIPRGKPSHVETMKRTFLDLGGLTNVKIYSVNPHMHLVGTHVSGKINRPAARGNDPKNECLANGNWNFDWQRTYAYDTALDNLPSVAVGDEIEVSCTWDNTIQNPFVQRMLHDSGLGAQPIDITLGEQTTNEMCLEIFGLAVDAPAEPVARTAPAGFTLPSLGALPRLR